MRIPKETKDAAFWDGWWRDRLSHQSVSSVCPLPIGLGPRSLYRLADGVDLLAQVMSEHGLQTILCAGNGVSQEPRALAAAGFDVTALDISPVATSYAEAYDADTCHLARFCSPERHRPGGRVEFVVGDLFDPTVCPGPFDVVIERRTVQWLAEHERAAGLSALAGRLNKVGIFMSQCLDDPFPPELGWSQHRSGFFHASESWFREQSWMICDEAASPPLRGRIAWLVRTGSIKPAPRKPDSACSRPPGDSPSA